MPARPWNAAEGQHVMVELSAEERRRRQQATLDAPRRRYGGDARLLFWVEDLVSARHALSPSSRLGNSLPARRIRRGSRAPTSR
jgi:hypothetical protein